MMHAVQHQMLQTPRKTLPKSSTRTLFLVAPRPPLKELLLDGGSSCCYKGNAGAQRGMETPAGGSSIMCAIIKVSPYQEGVSIADVYHPHFCSADSVNAVLRGCFLQNPIPLREGGNSSGIHHIDARHGVHDALRDITGGHWDSQSSIFPLRNVHLDDGAHHCAAGDRPPQIEEACSTEGCIHQGE